MFRILRRLPHLTLVVAVFALLAPLPPAAALASSNVLRIAAPGAEPGVAIAASLSPLSRLRSGAVDSSMLGIPRTGAHFLYVDNGALGDDHAGEVGMRLDSITAYQITLNGLIPVPGSPFPTNGFQNPVHAANSLAASAANGPCLFHTDGGTGQVESFAIAADGALTLASSVDLNVLLGDVDDVHVSADGKYVYVAQWNLLGPSYLDVLTVGSSCALTLASSVKRDSVLYYSIALVNSSSLMATDSLLGHIDIYRITNGTQLTLLSSMPSQLLNPSGAAAGTIGGRNYVFNGLNTLLPGETEAHTVNSLGKLGLVLGSPAIDLQSLDGEYVLFDHAHQQVIQSEQLSNTLGIYGAKLGVFQLLSHVTLPGAALPTAMTELGSELFVLNTLGGSVDACALHTGSAQCLLAANLPIFESPSGIAAL